MNPVEIWIGCIIGACIGVIFGELVNTWRAKRWARSLCDDLKKDG